MGCGDDPVSPAGVSGSMSFSFTGAGAANATTFSANGTIPSNINTTFGTGAWAAGSVSQTSNFTIVGAVIPKTSTTWDLTSIGIARKTVGTSDISADCDPETECTGVFVVFGQGGNGTAFTYSCGLTAGTVTVSAISATNITGTFSGTGFCFSAAGAESPFTVTSGTFNVGITTQLLD